MASRGTEDSFNNIVHELSRLHKAYEEKRIKHTQWAEGIDGIFNSYGWSKKEFYKELNARIGVETNESRLEEQEKKQR
jgi:hypothetical protein